MNQLTPDETAEALRLFAATTVELEEHQLRVKELGRQRRELLRRLLVGRTERELASLVGISQPRVRQLVGILHPPGGV